MIIASFKKLALHSRLRREVECRLIERWSPQQIAARVVYDYPDDPTMRVHLASVARQLNTRPRQTRAPSPIEPRPRGQWRAMRDGVGFALHSGKRCRAEAAKPRRRLASEKNFGAPFYWRR